jgi:hypothetical protein
MNVILKGNTRSFNIVYMVVFVVVMYMFVMFILYKRIYFSSFLTTHFALLGLWGQCEMYLITSQ